MKRTMIVLSIVCLTLSSLASMSHADEMKRTIRVGIYDNRAITMAFFKSQYNPFLQKRVERQDAETAGDSTKVQELDEWVEKFQRQLHFQGFCRVPVNDLLQYVKDKLEAVSTTNNLDLIGWYPDYLGEKVVTVDITMDLVALFEPPQETVDEIKNLKNVEPVSLADIDHDDH